MLRKWTFAVALVAVAVLVFSAAAFAQTAPGAGPDNPLLPDGTWTKVPASGEIWYIFHEEGDGETVNVDMKMVPNGGVSFEIWTPENLRDWAAEEEFDAVGEGTMSCNCEPEDELGKYNWTGSFVESGDYLVVVKNEMDAASYFTLDVTGKEVSLPLRGIAAAPAPEPAAAPAMAEEPVALAEGAGESPAFAMPISQEWTNLGEGGYHWYAFTYDQDEDYKPLEIRVFADPADAAVVTLRNEEQARLWAEEGEDAHFGCCTTAYIDPAEEDDELPYMRWMADNLASGQYYIVVSPAEGLTGDINYRLEVLGEGVFSEGMAQAAPAVEPVAAAAPAAEPVIEPIALAAEEGSGPALAMSLTDQMMTLEKDHAQWYAFTYDYDEDFGPLEVRVYADPAAAAVVTVRNLEQARLWEQEGENEHFGCCTTVFIDEEDDEKEPYMRWMADNLASGEYYIVVDLAQGFEGPATFRLEVLGEGVSS
jgi:hypothetical protein